MLPKWVIVAFNAFLILFHANNIALRYKKNFVTAQITLPKISPGKFERGLTVAFDEKISKIIFEVDFMFNELFQCLKVKNSAAPSPQKKCPYIPRLLYE